MSVVYQQRLNAFTPTRVYRVSQGALTWRDDKGGTGSLDLGKVTEVRLRFFPSRVQLNKYRLILNSGPAHTLELTNTSYRGIGDFVEQNRDFKRFARTLNGAVHEANPDARFFTGGSAFSYFANLSIMVFVTLMLGMFGWWAVQVGLFWTLALELLFLAYYIPATLRFVSRNKPSPYDPLRIPRDALPG